MADCYKTSNNKYFNAPPLMSDGRHFTDYRPSCIVNTMLKINNKLTNSYEYRKYLTQNADKIINQNRQVNYIVNGCYDCIQPREVGTMLPEQTIEQCNKGQCDVKPNFEDGVGIGRCYSVNKDFVCNKPGNYTCMYHENKLPKVDKNNQCGFKK